MIVVKVELHSAITGKITEIGRMVISNDGTAKDKRRGNYTARVCRRGSTNFLKPTREGKIANFPRKSYTIWKLVHKALIECFEEKKKQ